MRTEYVNVNNLIPNKLKKDLQDDEAICDSCGGLGIVVSDNVYGIKGDKSFRAKNNIFPYKHQSLSFCPYCYNGVQKVCEFCGTKLTRMGECQCLNSVNKRNEEKLASDLETRARRIKNAKKVDEKDIDEYLYCEETDDYYFNSDEFINSWLSNLDISQYGSIDNILDSIPNILWVTDARKIHIDAYQIAEEACDELHEDAYDNCDISELQRLIDKWCEKQTGTETYFPSYNEYVVINREDIRRNIARSL